jgi:hypothetical protein
MGGILWVANDDVSLGRISFSEAAWFELHDEEQLPNLAELLSRIASEELIERRIVLVFMYRVRMSGREGERNRSGQIGCHNS